MEWSEPISIINVGMSGIISCPIKGTDYCRGVASSIEFAGGEYGTLVKIIRISPRWVLLNRTQHTLKLKQQQQSRMNVIELASGYLCFFIY